MLQPKRTKFRKYQKGKTKNSGIQGNLKGVSFGKYGIQSVQTGRLSAQTIEAVRRTLTRHFQRKGQVWIRVFPDIAISKKPAEVRMGKGKGAPDFWACRVYPGQVLFEMDGIPLETAEQAYRLASHKFSFPTKFVLRNAL